MYNILGDIRKYCDYHQNGGIHIHVDMTQYLQEGINDSHTERIIKSYITKRLDEIVKIFPKYTGSYNKRIVEIRTKRSYVNISRLRTLEFRIAPLTFDYTTIITWISGLMKFRRKLITELRLIENHDLVTDGLVVRNNSSIRVRSITPEDQGYSIRLLSTPESPLVYNGSNDIGIIRGDSTDSWTHYYNYSNDNSSTSYI